MASKSTLKTDPKEIFARNGALIYIYLSKFCNLPELKEQWVDQTLPESHVAGLDSTQSKKKPIFGAFQKLGKNATSEWRKRDTSTVIHLFRSLLNCKHRGETELCTTGNPRDAVFWLLEMKQHHCRLYKKDVCKGVPKSYRDFFTKSSLTQNVDNKFWQIFVRRLPKTWITSERKQKKEGVAKTASLVFLVVRFSFQFPGFSRRVKIKFSKENMAVRPRFQRKRENVEILDQATTLHVMRTTLPVLFVSKRQSWTIRQKNAGRQQKAGICQLKQREAELCQAAIYGTEFNRKFGKMQLLFQMTFSVYLRKLARSWVRVD